MKRGFMRRVCCVLVCTMAFSGTNGAFAVCETEGDEGSAIVPVYTEEITVTPAPLPEETPAAGETPGGAETEETPAPDGVLLRPYDETIGWRGEGTGLTTMRLWQADYPETVCLVNGEKKSVATSGCGAVCIAMVIAMLTGNTEQDPYSLFYLAAKEGWYTGDGLTHRVLSRFARQNGLPACWTDTDAETVKKSLDRGLPVVVHIGEGHFASEGHYLLLTGYERDGSFVVFDPANENNCGAFPGNMIFRETRSKEPFLFFVSDLSELSADPSETEGAGIDDCPPNAEAVEVPAEEDGGEPQDPEETVYPEQTAAPEPSVDPQQDAEGVGAVFPEEEPAVAGDPKQTAATEEQPEKQGILVLSGSDRLVGDVNASGTVDINDAQLLMDILAGRYSAGGLEPDKLLAADVNGDGVVDELDLKMILSMIETKQKGVK